VKTIVVSDVHLGGDKSDKAAFNAFLSSLRDDHQATDLVLLGDIVDMWRRDASGVFLENIDTVKIIMDLQNKLKVHCVAGNHDYHLLKLKNFAPHHHYPLEFTETLELRDGDCTYRFMHGHEFEYGKELTLMRPIMETLCHVMSDSEGVVEDELWAHLERKVSYLRYRVLTMKARSLKDGPEVRFKDKLEHIERRAYDEIRGKSGQLLVFGHTHHPFINQREDLVNTGSWLKDATTRNTYVELKGGRPRLFVFGGEEIKDRQEVVQAGPLVQGGFPITKE
jgi:UDP-2,3-diacylglucosamine pyrophosphatase LpxH